MTTLGAVRDSALELDLQSQGSTQVIFYTNVLSHLDLVARNVFAPATPCTVLLADRGWPRGGAASDATVREPDAAAQRVTTSSSAPVLEAIEDLRTWLHVSYEELAQILGWRSASVIYYWRQRAREDEPVRPRAASVEPVLRLHALLRAVSETISGDSDPSAVQGWTRTPLPETGVSPLDLLRTGHIEALEKAASPLIFGNSTAALRDWRVMRAEQQDEEIAPQRSTTYRPEDFG